MSDSKNFVELLYRQVKQNPNKEFICTKDVSLDYETFFKLALGYSRNFNKYSKGSRIAIECKAYDSFYIVLFACWMKEMSVVPINISLTDSKKNEIKEIAGVATTVLEDVSPQEMDHECIKDMHLPKPNFLDEALCLFTSGTTGTPKGVSLSHHNIHLNTVAVVERLNLDETDRLFINTPPYYTSGICHFLTMTFTGGTMIYNNGFYFGDDLIRVIESAKATGFGGAPAHVMKLYSGLREKKEIALKFWVSSGDHLPCHILKDASKFLPNIKFYVMYGLTETAGRLFITKGEDYIKSDGCLGYPIGEMEVKIMNEENEEVTEDESGVLYVKGNMLMNGYINPELKTSISESGFYCTGDIGKWVPNNGLKLLGRNDDVIKRGGEKVSLVEIQDTLLQMQGVLDAFVKGLDDELVGKVPIAYVVLKDKTIKEIRTHLKKTLPLISMPAKFIELEEIPRLASGKVARSLINE